MKKQILTIASLALFVGVVILSGCKKDDTTGPVITLTGDAIMSSTLNATFTDPGATATDDNDGTVDVVVTGTVNKDLTGAYTLTYTATDAAGNSSTKDRTVNVVNSVAGNAGSYTATDDWNSDGTVDYTWTEAISASSTVNNQIIFSKFANYTGCSLKANVNGSSLSFPGTQTYMCGSGTQQNRTFTITSGTISATLITINYHEVDADLFTTDGVDTFTK